VELLTDNNAKLGSVTEAAGKLVYTKCREAMALAIG